MYRLRSLCQVLGLGYLVLKWLCVCRERPCVCGSTPVCCKLSQIVRKSCFVAATTVTGTSLSYLTEVHSTSLAWTHVCLLCDAHQFVNYWSKWEYYTAWDRRQGPSCITQHSVSPMLIWWLVLPQWGSQRVVTGERETESQAASMHSIVCDCLIRPLAVIIYCVVALDASRGKLHLVVELLIVKVSEFTCTQVLKTALGMVAPDVEIDDGKGKT